MQQKLKKIKEDTDTKLSEFVIKLKKKSWNFRFG